MVSFSLLKTLLALSKIEVCRLPAVLIKLKLFLSFHLAILKWERWCLVQAAYSWS
jgi:hypothetical protein